MNKVFQFLGNLKRDYLALEQGLFPVIAFLVIGSGLYTLVMAIYHTASWLFPLIAFRLIAHGGWLKTRQSKRERGIEE